MSFKLQQENLIEIVEYMEKHPEFATGRLSVAHSRDKFKEMWRELSMKLNSLGFGTRAVEKWQKTWTDYKTNLKKKASEIKRYQEGTGGGPELKKKLTDLELRVLGILGKTFYEGCAVRELGLRDQGDKTTESEHDTEPATTNNWVSISGNHSNQAIDSEPSSSKLELCASNIKNKRKNVSCTNEYGKDHDYLSSFPDQTAPKKIKTDMTTLYKQTIDNLERIERTVANGLQNITSTMGSKMDELCETVSEGFKLINDTLRVLQSQLPKTDSF